MANFLNNISNGQISNQGFTSNINVGNGAAVSLLDMKPGDTFQGEIYGVNGNEVQLKLAYNQLLAARIEGQVSLALGQLLTFQVQSNKDAHIVLKPIYNNLVQQQVGVAALKAANLPVSDKNMTLVSQLLDNGMPIDKNSLINSYRQVLQHPTADANSVLNLLKLNIPVTDSNIKGYESFKNLEHKILDSVNSITDELFKTYDSLKGEEANSFMDKVIKFLDSDTQGKTQTQEQSTDLNEKGNIATDNSKDVISNNGVEVKVNTQTTNTQNTDTINPTEKNAGVTVKHDTDVTNAKTDNKEIVSNDSTNNQTNKNAGLLSTLTQKLNDSEKQQLFKSYNFKDTVKAKLIQRFTMSPEEIKEPGKIKEFYSKLLSESDELTKLMKDTPNSENLQLGQSTQTLHNNIDFMNQVNNIFQYVQLPIKMSQGKAQGELYVFTNKRHMASKDGSLTALLHLDMENLGKMDINITLQTDNNMVTTKFFLQEDVIDFVEEHMDELTKKLEEKGYRTKSYVGKMNEEKNVVDRMHEQMSGKIAPLSYQAFDMRT